MRKLHRNTQDKKIAGVCSGLGDYFEMDPVLVRVFFLVFTFIGGLGLITYIVMALIVPQEDGTIKLPNNQKKLYLSETDKKLTGVCGGIGEYLDVDPTLIRVGFILSVLCAGIGVILYIALFFILPKHKITTTSPLNRKVSNEQENNN